MEGQTNREPVRGAAARRRGKQGLSCILFSAAWLAALAAGAQLIPPVVDDWARGGLTDVEGWAALSNNAGRVTLVPGTPLGDFSAAGTPFSNTTYFRGNTYAASAGEKTLLGHELYLDRDTPVEVTFCVYESAHTNGPFLRIDAATIFAPAGAGFVGSGQRCVPLRSGKFYAIGAAVNESSSYQRLGGVILPFEGDGLTCVKGIGDNSVPGDSVASFSTYSNPYRQRLRVAGGFDSVPGKFTLTDPATTTYMRGNIFAATNSSWLLGHGLYLAGDDANKTVSLFVYESNTRTGVYTRLDLQSVTAPAGATNYVSVATQLPLAAGKYYLLGGQCGDGISVHYASHYYDTPQGFDWGQAVEGFSRAGAPPETVTKPAATNETVYRACVTVGDRPAVRMDTSAVAMSTNSLTVVVSSGGFTDLTLEFDHRESSDEFDDGDGVFVSANGIAFTRVMTIEGSSSWRHYETNIIALAQANGISTANNLHIRFQQMDNYSWSGNDGREFANVRVYSKPDLAWNSLAASPTNYLFRGAVSKTLTFSGATRLAGGDAAVTGLTVSVRHCLYDDQSTVQYTYASYTPDIPAFGHRLEDFDTSVVVPAGTLLTQSLYHVSVSLDSGGALAEGRENNNTSTSDFLVNHYSGWLRFSNTAANVTLTGWSFQSGYGAPVYSPERHLITGTGTLGGHAFGFTNLMVRKQMGTCDYVIDPGETQVLFLPGTRDTTNTVAGVRFVLDSNVALSRHGVTAAATVLFPAGCAFAESADKPWGVTAARISGGVQLDANLRPTGTFEPSPDYTCFYEESKPLFFEVSGITWNASAGTFAIAVSGVAYAHGAALDQLDGLASSGQIPASDAVRRSNDGYYRSVANATNITLSCDARGAGQLNFSVDIETNRFRVHMPYNAEIGWNKPGRLIVTNDLPVVSPLVSELDDGLNVGVYYGSGCPGGCSGADNTRLLSCINEADAFYFTEDGGLYAPCSFAGGQADLRWGYIPASGAFAQRAYGFKFGVLHVPGHFLCADDCPAALSEDDTPGALVLSAVGGAGDELVRPHGAGYADGDGNYAGVTVQWESQDSLGETLLGGKELFGFALDESCKLYVRQTGVSGIHVADSSLGQLSVTLYGYSVVLNNLAFSYLSTENLESRTEGRVAVPSPCDITVDFEELKLTCMGDLASAEPADPSAKLTLAYWSALVQPSTIGFASEDDCDIGERTLVMDVSTTVDNIPDTLFGRLGFLANGNLSAEADAGAGGSSRLSLPTTVTLPGPEDSTYTLYPVANAYFNDYRQRGDLSSIGDGLLTFAAELDVPFFENMLVQAFTSADTSGGTSPVYLVGGWPSKGWTISGHSPFDNAAFDAANAAHPTNSAAPSFSDYLAGTDADYIPRARREWISGIGFDIGVRWDAASLSFRSPEPVENDLYVLQTEYNVPQLTAERVEITFGLTYGELPELNLSSIFFNAVDEATGISDCLTSVVGDAVTGALDSGVTALDTLTATDPTDLLGNTLADQLDPFVDTLYVALTNAYATGGSVTNTIGRYIRGGAGAPANNLRHLLDQLVDGTSGIGTGLGVAEDLQGRIDEALTMIDAVAFEVDDPIMGTADGLLNKVGDDYPLLEVLGRVLMIFAIPSMTEADTAIEQTITDIMDTLEPTLDSVRDTLAEVRGQLEDVRSALNTAGEFRDELAAALDPAQLTDLADTVADRLDEEFAALEGPFSPAENYTPDELKALIRATILDALREASPIANIQRIVRARMLDVDRQIRGGVDSVLGQVNWAMRETLSQVVGSLDTSISGMVGDFSDVLGTGQVEGYAHIAGDSLDKLRLDLLMQMKVPEEMQFAGYLEIVNEQTSASGGCAFDEGSTYKVTLGAEDVSCNWLGSDVRINCSCFFTLNDGVPKGMGGALELVDGTINFEAAEINRFGAAVAFGALENYLAAATRVTINDSVEMEGGIFFGRTCTMTPILIVDPEVGDALGAPPFTGAYVYGEGWIPIYDYGCVFRIKSGAGFGVFYFAEGPTYGVRIMLGAEGEALCVVSVRGEVDIYGLKQGDSYRASGKGKIKGKVGSCPFCVKFNKTVKITYDDGEWDADY